MSNRVERKKLAQNFDASILARIAYKAYVRLDESAPEFDTLPQEIREAWLEVGMAVLVESARRAKHAMWRLMFPVKER